MLTFFILSIIAHYSQTLDFFMAIMHEKNKTDMDDQTGNIPVNSLQDYITETLFQRYLVLEVAQEVQIRFVKQSLSQ